MNTLQLGILTICTDIAQKNHWDMNVVFDCSKLCIAFTCHESSQKDCHFELEPNPSELDYTTLQSNLIDLLFGNIIELPNSNLLEEKLCTE